MLCITTASCYGNDAIAISNLSVKIGFDNYSYISFLKIYCKNKYLTGDSTLKVKIHFKNFIEQIIAIDSIGLYSEAPNRRGEGGVCI